MRHLFFVAFWLGLFITPGLAQSQSAVKECKECKKKCLCEDNFAMKYTDEQKKLIRYNWTDYEGDLLEDNFPVKGIKNIISIRFDGFGCVYPSFIDDRNLEDEFLNEGIRHTALRARTFYSLMRKYPKAMTSSDPELQKTFTDLAAIAGRNFKSDSATLKNFLDFRTKWNDRFLTEVITMVKEKTKTEGIRQCVFFVSGYNVPYSLTHLQGNAVFSDVLAELPPAIDNKKILFVRIFWPSNSAKKKNLSVSSCNVDNRFRPDVSKLYKFITNRTYLSGLSMRKIINGLDEDIKLHIISHSFGASLSTAVVLNPDSRIRDHSLTFNRMLIEEFSKEDIPTSHTISFFLSAPGIPGKNTFISLDPVKNKNHYFYVGFNENDKILKKNIIPFLTFAGRKNATSLGCNWRNEVDSVKKVVAVKKMESNFTYCHNSTQKNHDYFCYRIQDSFIRNFSGYVKNMVGSVKINN